VKNTMQSAIKKVHVNPQNLTLIGVMLAVVIVMQVMFPLFLTPANIETLLMNFVFEGIIALGMTFVILTGGIDLSVASVFPLAEILVAKLMLQADMPILPAILITLGICVGIGILNGFLIDLLGVNPMIITMGMMLTLKGVNLAITDGSSITGFSIMFLNLGQGKLLFINAPIWLFAVLAIVLSYLLNNNAYFRQVYSIGGNEKAARLSGVNVRKVKIVIYALCAFLAALAGIFAASRYGAAQWGHGNNLEMRAVSAVAIGGASMAGGSGRIGGTVLGAIFLAIVNNAFVMAGINPFWYDIVNGGMLLIAVMLSVLADWRNERSILLRKDRFLAQ